MAAGVSTYAMVVDLIPEIWEGALDYLKKNFVAPMNVRVFTDQRGFTPRNVSQYVSSGSAQNLTESTDLTAYEFDRNLLATLTPAEKGHRIDLYDARLETDPENVIVDATRELGYVLGVKMETDILGNINSFTGGTISAPSSAFSLNQIAQARALLANAGVPGPYVAVIHEFQYLDIFEDLAALSAPAPFNIREQAIQSFYVPRFADVKIVVAPHLPVVAGTGEVQSLTHTGTVSGGTFTLELVGYGAATAAIAYNASASAIEEALELVLGEGNVSVTVGAGPPNFVLTFLNDLALVDLPLITVDDALITGGGTIDAAQVSAGSPTTATAGVYNQQAIALDMRRGLRIEPDRDASARRTELNATMVYAHGGWRLNHGVKIVTDASAPS